MANQINTTYTNAMVWGAAGALLMRPGIVLFLTKNLNTTISTLTTQFTGSDLKNTVKLAAGGALAAALMIYMERATPNIPLVMRMAELGAGMIGGIYLIPTLESFSGISL